LFCFQLLVFYAKYKYIIWVRNCYGFEICRKKNVCSIYYGLSIIGESCFMGVHRDKALALINLQNTIYILMACVHKRRCVYGQTAFRHGGRITVNENVNIRMFLCLSNVMPTWSVLLQSNGKRALSLILYIFGDRK